MVKIHRDQIAELCGSAGLHIIDVTNIRITPTGAFFTYLARNADGHIFVNTDTGRLVESFKSVPITLGIEYSN